MNITREQLLDLLSQEIQWCMRNPEKASSREYWLGFIDGLEQAKYIVRASEHPRPLQTTSSRMLFLKPDGGQNETQE